MGWEGSRGKILGEEEECGGVERVGWWFGWTDRISSVHDVTWRDGLFVLGVSPMVTFRLFSVVDGQVLLQKDILLIDQLGNILSSGLRDYRKVSYGVVDF